MKTISISNQFFMFRISEKWQTIIFCLLHCGIFLIVFQSEIYGTNFHNDIATDYEYSSYIVHGFLPYRDFLVEYPPLALIFMTIPRLFSQNILVYIWAYAVEILIFDILGLLIISRLAKNLRLSLWKTLSLYTLSLLAIGPIIATRFDLIPGILALLAVYTFMKGRYKTAWGLLAVGIMTKLFPIIIAPFFIIYQLRNRQKRQLKEGVLCVLVTCLVVILPGLILSPSGLWETFEYHAQRGLQIESIYASILELLNALNVIHLRFIFNFGSYNINSPIGDIFSNLSFFIMLLCLIATYIGYFILTVKKPEFEESSLSNTCDTKILAGYTTIAIIVFTLTNKVFSPEYIIWIYPFIALITGNRRTLSCLLFILIGLMTFFIYPIYYTGILLGDVLVCGILLLRNLSLLGLAITIQKNIASALGRVAKRNLS
jgi:uncharacterized membrane protein